MPGIFGFTRQNQQNNQNGLLQEMAAVLEPENRSRRELHTGDGFSFGRLTLGIVNPERQPVWDDRRNMGIVFEGEIFNRQELIGQLKSKGVPIDKPSNPELALRLFKAYGEAFPARINGSFALAIWDQSTRRLMLINDRLGLHPIYYAQTNYGLIFGSGVRALLADPQLSREVDPFAVAQFLTFDHVLDTRTLLKKVRLLPQATILTYSDNQLEIRPYWELKYPKLYNHRTQEDLVDELVFHLRNAIRRQSPGELPAGLLLSGGMDSRFLMALLAEDYDIDQLHTFTWGIPGCDDARIAREIASHMSSQHHFFELKPDYLLHKAEEAVRLTDGMGNIINMHALATLEEETQFAQVLYKGFLGDAMMGFALQRPFWADYDADTAEAVHLSVHQFQGVYYYDRDEQKASFTDDFYQTVGSSVFETYQQGMQRADHNQLAVQRLFFDFTQRVPRHTMNGVMVARSRAVVRLPFADNDLVDFSLTIPPGYHFGRHLMRLAFTQSYPDLAKIPVSDTGLPMISCARDLLLRTKQFLQWHVNQRGIDWPTRRPYKDYANWFRGVLRPWVEGTLLSDSSLNRGYIKPEYIRNLVSGHMAGDDHTIKLGQLLSLELWHRHYID